MKLPISPNMETEFRQADLLKRYETYLNAELEDQVAGAKVLAKWLRNHQLGMLRLYRGALQTLEAGGTDQAGGIDDAGGN
jgi:hypothetical protein